ncbi:MAG: transposase family protein [Planctomyces sp.]|nr:transposase family protein [Planctomyces sp.]
MASQAQLATFEELVACFEDLEDPRSEINRKHPLVSVVAISTLAVLAGEDGPTSIHHRWTKSLKEQLLLFLDLPNGIPCLSGKPAISKFPVAFWGGVNRSGGKSVDGTGDSGVGCGYSLHVVGRVFDGRVSIAGAQGRRLA